MDHDCRFENQLIHQRETDGYRGVIEFVARDASAASRILRSYIDDVSSRYYGRQVPDEEIDASQREDPESTWRLRPACSSLPFILTRSWAGFRGPGPLAILDRLAVCAANP